MVAVQQAWGETGIAPQHNIADYEVSPHYGNRHLGFLVGNGKFDCKWQQRYEVILSYEPSVPYFCCGLLFFNLS